MPAPPIGRPVEPITPGAISYFRTRLRCGLSERVKSPSIAPAQALLLFSLTYGAGATPQELAKMPVSSLLNPRGDPASDVRFEPSVTKHRTSRRVTMHADIQRDLLAFRYFFPDEEWIAFRARPTLGVPPRLAASAITSWFRSCLREAGLGQFTIASARKAFNINRRGAA
jgi:hypothetical protein